MLLYDVEMWLMNKDTRRRLIVSENKVQEKSLRELGRGARQDSALSSNYFIHLYQECIN